MRRASLIISGGTIRTMDPSRPQAEAIAVKDGRILAVGRLSEIEALSGAQTKRVDLAGRTLLPGFNDAHVHLWKVGGLRTTMLDLREVDSLAELKERVRARAQTLPPGGWLLGRGYNEARLREGRGPTRHDLDEAAPGAPVLLTRTCAHIHAASSRALKLAGIDRETPDPPGGEIERDALGEPTGVLLETAYGLVQKHLPAPGEGELEGMIAAASKHLLSLGVTSATDPAVDEPLRRVYLAMAGRGALPLRVNLLYIRRPDGGKETLPLPEKHTSNLLRLDSVKFFADGGLSGATAKIREPYKNTPAPTTGVLRFETEELYELALEAHKEGFRIGTHAIGDVAIEQVLSVYERLQEVHPAGLRHRLEHFGLPSAEHLRRAAKLTAIAVPQAVFISELGGNFRRYLPESYLSRPYPLRAMLDAGLTVALSSDGPVVRELSPLAGVAAAVMRGQAGGEALAPEQAIGVGEALYAYTMGGAIAQGDEANRGSLSPGKWADMVVLERDPFKTPPEELADIPVIMTFLARETAYFYNPG
jgi:predicted amidohydrolase YtcJ